MPKSIVSKHTPLELVHLPTPPMWRPEQTLLDQNGFPWKLHDNYEVDGYWAMLEPLRKRPHDIQISTLVPFEEGVAEAYLNRVIEYISKIESLDLEIKKIRSGTWFGEWAASEWVTNPSSDFRHDLEVTPNDTITFTDSLGMEWGPLNCSPLVEPVEWPFPGGIRADGLTWRPKCKEIWTVKMGPLQMDVYSIHDLNVLVADLHQHGWLETIKRRYPDGMKLEDPKKGPPQGLPDVERFEEDAEFDGMNDGG
jgi:hypothetical protein